MRFGIEEHEASSENQSDKESETGNATARQLMDLIKMQSYRCALTGSVLTPEDAELDHKIPLSKGGTNQLGNLQWIAKEVNKAKGRMTNEEFVAMCKQVATYTPQCSSYL